MQEEIILDKGPFSTSNYVHNLIVSMQTPVYQVSIQIDLKISPNKMHVLPPSHVGVTAIG